MKKVPFFENRNISDKTTCKFQDDYYIERVKELQNHRKFRHISFNPFTGEYTNGKDEKERNEKCMEMKYWSKNKNKYIENILQRKIKKLIN